MDALVAVRHWIAHAILSPVRTSDHTLGVITLQPHQHEAAQRLNAALAWHGGALLSDAPGLGKTYTALAVARPFGIPLIIAPAALRAQWYRSAAQAGMRITWCSHETLSRRPVASDCTMLIVDEAHHLRNSRARRYAHAAQLAIGKRVLLLSATPVHNRPSDCTALLALFLGHRAVALQPMERAQMIVKRDADPALLPRRTRVRWIRGRDAPELARLVRALPPPLPAADGRTALALIRMTLLHAQSSSIAALDAAVRHGLQRAAVIDDALCVGRWPTRRELRAWVTSDDSTQLAFAELLATPTRTDLTAARTLLATYRTALTTLRLTAARLRDADAAMRADALRRLVSTHTGATIIAFSRYAATVDALWRVLRLDAGVVAITARAVRSAGGGLRRADLLAALTSGTVDARRAPLRLVLSTDLLGEGLDLRAVSVIVHLDLPWTPARLDQREGRATRLSSPHAAVTVYAMRPPRSAAGALAIARRLTEKRASMRSGLAPSDVRERLCTLVRPWLRTDPAPCTVAAVTAGDTAWIAVVLDAGERARVIACCDGTVHERDECVLRLLSRSVHGQPTTVDARAVRRARRAIRAWLVQQHAAAVARVSHSDSPARADVVRRFDLAMRRTPLHERHQLQERFAAAMHQLAVARGAGAERVLARAARCESVDEMLSLIAALASEPAQRQPSRRTGRLLALLLLASSVDHPTAADRAPCSAALSGSAGPR